MAEKKDIHIIAEIAQGYEGKPEYVHQFLETVKQTKADAIKFQIFYADELALPDYQYYGLFKKLEIPFEIWAETVSKAHEAGLKFYSDVFGLRSLNELVQIGIDGIKIHATDINNEILLKAVGQTGKPIFLATGGCEKEEIKHALGFLRKCAVTLMFGFQAEPTEIIDNHLRRIPTLRDEFKLPVGFMDHTEGGTDLAYYLPFIAIGAGATVIEKHMTLNRAQKMEDYISALNADEFKEWSMRVKASAPALGESRWQLTAKEKMYRNKVKRTVCAADNLQKGKKIKSEHLILKRSASKDAFNDMREVIGKTLKENIKENTPISKEILS
ncbi:MAG: hypothetical protein COV74_09600 [Candidatus Omnitrophica bacterium CG11_big_fil_rev_8_21_14_0_20_45_26]|uniref:SAF domain-containing protein n=1 Tax=Candidatus Abzuiibacterium crystallinum TaxID=1974748 RepID=A0A2H0LLB8_9BACT|nr:MAG: hypothetical protein COV74_09600 [Candidatus Omnitrophica bacterium CG11_big_fil_rev_8_21_14_0_20_45_26]PIW65399.1 MAG: hypothetical protein COW12_02170 [Candidatus Omnitrophica bacterium CG12_big_fil_rev_8_21_14_0_65_45_16]